MRNIQLQVYQLAYQDLKTVGWTGVVTKEMVKDWNQSGDNWSRIWSLDNIFSFKIIRDLKMPDEWSSLGLGFIVGYYRPKNRAWYKYYNIDFDESDKKTVFSLQKKGEEKQTITGVDALMNTPLSFGEYTLILEKESEDLKNSMQEAGFMDEETDRKCLVDGVNHMLRGRKIVPFDFTKIPSEEIPWVIECCGRQPQYQLWGIRKEHAKFWLELYQNSNELKDVKKFFIAK